MKILKNVTIILLQCKDPIKFKGLYLISFFFLWSHGNNFSFANFSFGFMASYKFTLWTL